jgi:acyl-homoserine lactone acylase PvdQ
MRGLLDAFSAGLNGWLNAHPGDRVLTRIEPWYPLALIRFKYYELEFLGYAGLENEQWERLMREGWPVGEPTRSGAWPPGPDDAGGAGAQTQAQAGAPSMPTADAPTQARARAPAPPFRASRYDALGERPFGSNQVALGPSRTASGHAMLLINPHQSFVGVQRYAEIHLHSAETLRFSGLTVFGFLLPYMGHNERLGWAYTDNYADHSDLYAETFDDPARPLAYRYGTGYREAETWVDTIRVRTDDALHAHPYRFWRTHHGPIVGMDERGRPLRCAWRATRRAAGSRSGTR